MLIELIGFFGVTLIFLFVFAEFFKHRTLAIIASIILLVLGVIILATGIQFPIGTNTIEVLL